MNLQEKNVNELTSFAALLEQNKCSHFSYDEVSEHLNMMLDPLPKNISFEEEQTLEELLAKVFSVTKVHKTFLCDGCNGCKNVLLMREVLMKRTVFMNIISTLWKTLSSGEFTFY